MKNFNRFCAILLVCLFLPFGCASFKADIAKVETKIESIDWCAVATYWADFVKGLNEALPVVETLFPGTKGVVNQVVTPVLNDANTAVTAFTTTVQAYQAGTLTEAQVTAAAQEVQSSAVAASNLVSQALKGKIVTTPVSAATTAVPTK
jgi:hypothetical protein